MSGKKEPIGFHDREDVRRVYNGDHTPQYQGHNGGYEDWEFGGAYRRQIYTPKYHKICSRKGCNNKTGGAEFCSLDCYGLYKLEKNKETLERINKKVNKLV